MQNELSTAIDNGIPTPKSSVLCKQKKMAAHPEENQCVPRASRLEKNEIYQLSYEMVGEPSGVSYVNDSFCQLTTNVWGSIKAGTFSENTVGRADGDPAPDSFVGIGRLGEGFFSTSE